MYAVLFIIGFVHLLNDSLQAVIPAMFPILEKSMALYIPVGLIAFSLNVTSSIMQRWWAVCDKRLVPMPCLWGCALLLSGCWDCHSAVFRRYSPGGRFNRSGLRRLSPGGLPAGLPGRQRQPTRFRPVDIPSRAATRPSLAPLITALVLVPLGLFGAIWFSQIAALAVGCALLHRRWYAGRLKNNPIRQNPAASRPAAPSRARSSYSPCSYWFFLFSPGPGNSAPSPITTPSFLCRSTPCRSKRPKSISSSFWLSAPSALPWRHPGRPIRQGNIIVFSMVATVPLALLLPHAGPRLAYLILGVTGR